MEWSERMNTAIGYIEDNLAGEIDFSEAADKACCSLFHFQRMFFAIIGVTPAEYTRQRRLTLAAKELITTNDKVIDIALKYGYDSPEAFTRAFRNVHGINPQAARASGVKLTAFPRISFYIELKGGNDMDYRIIEKPAFTAAGRVRHFSSDVEQNMVKIGEWCIEFMNSAERQELVGLVRNKPGAVTGGMMLGICIHEGQMEGYSYAITVELPEGTSPSPFETVEIPAAIWAVFETTLDLLPQSWRQIFKEWFPSTGYEHTGGPELEVYLPGDMNPDSKCQLWVPVVKREKPDTEKKKH
jgi:AraC family transcriptional regulator